jgi:antirestriction protein ArdC
MTATQTTTEKPAPLDPKAAPHGPGSPKRPEAFQKLEQAIEQACSAGGWRAYLTAQARFHRYSFRNLLLILEQSPNATRVAGFHDWLKHSRHVRKGEKGIVILAPMKWQKHDKDTGETTSGIGGFRVVYVFDIAQTDGEPLPERPQVTFTDGSSEHAAILTQTLTESLKRAGIPVLIQNLPPGEYGLCNHATRTITLSSALGDIQRFSVLVHETAHAHLHAHRQQITLEDAKHAKALREFEAESVACVVLEHFGINTLECSAQYLASYGATPEHLVKIGARVQSCAAQIIGILEESNRADDAGVQA